MKEYSIHTLTNGLRVFYFQYPHLRSTEIRMFLRGGKHYENSNEVGLSHFVEHLLFRGTKKYPKNHELWDKIQSIGGYINGHTGWESLSYPIKTTFEFIDLSSDGLNELLQNALLEEKDVIHEKKTVIEEITRRINKPEEYMMRSIIPSMIYKDRITMTSFEEEIENVKSFTVEQVRNYYDRFYNVNNMLLTVVSDRPAKETLDTIEKNLHSLPQGKIPDRKVEPAKNEAGIRFIKREMDQIDFGFGVETFDITDEREPTAKMLLRILSTGLFKELREEKGLTYGTNVSGYFSHFSGSFFAAIATKKENIVELTNSTIKFIEKTKKEIDEIEFEKARNILMTWMLFREENPREYSWRIGNEALFTDKLETTEEQREKILTVTKKDVMTLCQEYFDKGKMSFAFLGSVDEKVKKDLKKILL